MTAVSCPRCGAPLAHDQEYCVDCGLRQREPSGIAHALGKGWRKVIPWYPGDWLWPALLAALVAAAGATVAIAATGGTKERQRTATIVATQDLRPVPPPAPPATRKPPPKPAKGSKPAPPPPPPAAPAGPRTWPALESGFTNVISSLPISGGLAAAKAAAQKAIDAGVPDVGVLASATFSSLHPGYYVVFSGVYDTLEEAQGNLPKVTVRYPAAYARRIAR